MQESLSLPLLDAELARLRNQLAHLERSNEELKQSFHEDPEPVFKTSLQENIVLIAKLRARLASLEELHKAALCAIPTTDEAPQQRQQQRQQI